MPENHPSRHASAARPSAELTLAAVERAERHGPVEMPGVPFRAVVAHLGLPLRTGEAAAVRARLRELESSHLIKRTRRYGADVWTLSESGSDRLRVARRDGVSTDLPESPQHRDWRDARRAGAAEIERFRDGLDAALQEAVRLLPRDPPAHSDAWFELAERLHRSCRRVGSASHCVYEWSEPDDAWGDVDDRREPGDEQLPEPSRRRRRALRAGRRNILLWGEPPC
jgi:hypothetical protein